MTRDDWVNASIMALTNDGISSVKIALLAEQLNVARSSFYWHFTGRADLEAALLDTWNQRNIAPILQRAVRPAPTVTAAVYGLFECWADLTLFDHRLEFAIREWARRDDTVRRQLHESDEARIDAIAAMHRRFGDDATTATVRARVHYHSQIGMYALGVDEPLADRLRMVPTYVAVFAGTPPHDHETATFATWVHHTDTSV